MGSKVIVLFGLLLAMVILISSEVSARDLAETSNTEDATNQPDQYGGRGGYGGGRGGYGGGRGGYGGGNGGYGGGRGGYGGGNGGYGGGRGGYGGGNGGYGGGRGGYGGGCRYGRCYGRCCNFAGEKVDASEPQT